MPDLATLIAYVLSILDELGITTLIAALVVIAGGIRILHWLGVLKD